MRVTLFPLILFLSALFFLSGCNTAFAEEASFSATSSAIMQPTGNDIGVSKITPASYFYFLKTVREGIEIKLAFTPHVKLIRQLEFATRRLREVKSLIPTPHQDLIQPTLERYSAYLNSLPQKDLQDEEVATRIKESLIVHLEVLEQIYPKITNKSAKMAIRAAINRIALRADVPILGRLPVCNFLQKEATSLNLIEVEKEILLERAHTCFKGI